MPILKSVFWYYYKTFLVIVPISYDGKIMTFCVMNLKL